MPSLSKQNFTSIYSGGMKKNMFSWIIVPLPYQTVLIVEVDVRGWGLGLNIEVQICWQILLPL